MNSRLPDAAENRIFPVSAVNLPKISANRPLIICDVDEVVLSFLDLFEKWIGKQGLSLARDSFSLNENLRGRAGVNVSAKTLRTLLHAVFSEATHDLTPVVFIDDSPKNIASCLDFAPRVINVHLVPDHGFRQHAAVHPDVGLFTGDWNEAARYILEKIKPM